MLYEVCKIYEKACNPDSKAIDFIFSSRYASFPIRLSQSNGEVTVKRQRSMRSHDDSADWVDLKNKPASSSALLSSIRHQ